MLHMQLLQLKLVYITAGRGLLFLESRVELLSVRLLLNFVVRLEPMGLAQCLVSCL